MSQARHNGVVSTAAEPTAPLSSSTSPQKVPSPSPNPTPPRPRHQITRSISEISSPIRLHRQHSLRATTGAGTGPLTSAGASKRDNTRDRDSFSPSPPAQLPTAQQQTTPQSAVVTVTAQGVWVSPLSGGSATATQGRHSLDESKLRLTRGEENIKENGGTPNLSPNSSRRGSLLFVSATSGAPSGEDGASMAGGLSVAPSSVAPSSVALSKVSTRERDSRDVGLIREQQWAAARETGLRQTLGTLQAFSTSSTRRLDESYYSVLEKLGTLRHTIGALKEIAEMSRGMNNTFDAEAKELAAEVSSQLDPYGQFEEQERRISKLKGRIRVGREKIRSLSNRVDVVKERIDSWERADREWQERVRWRLRLLWVCFSVAAFAWMALFFWGVRRAGGDSKAMVSGSGGVNPKALKGTSVESLSDIFWGLTGNGTDTAEISGPPADGLRAFDEL